MTDYDPGRYGRIVGGSYDELYPAVETESAEAVAFLAGLAADHPLRSVLEFGIGTGRIVLGLRAAGIGVAGIDGSESMVSQLRAKPGGTEIQVTLGDYRDARAPGRFSVVVLALNGIFDPRGMAAQIDIFRNAARHLGSDGYFVVESWVMSDEQRGGDWSVVPRYVGHEHLELQLSRYELSTNRIERTLVHLRPDGIRFLTVTDTYASPEQLDVMAEVANFQRVARHRDWVGHEFTATSSRQISVYRLGHHTPEACNRVDRPIDPDS